MTTRRRKPGPKSLIKPARAVEYARRFAAGEMATALAAEAGVSPTTMSRAIAWAVARGDAPARDAGEVRAADTDAAGEYTCARCGRAFVRFATPKRHAAPPTVLGGRPFCPECAAARFRRRACYGDLP